MATNYKYQKKLILNGGTYYIAIPIFVVESLKLKNLHAGQGLMSLEYRPQMKDIVIRRVK